MQKRNFFSRVWNKVVLIKKKDIISQTNKLKNQSSKATLPEKSAINTFFEIKNQLQFTHKKFRIISNKKEIKKLHK